MRCLPDTNIVIAAMGPPAFEPATCEHLELPENWVDGPINGPPVTHPRVAPKRARAYSALGEALGSLRGLEGDGAST